MTLAVWPRASKGDCESVRAVVRISERRSRLLGLDAMTAARIELATGPPVSMDVENPYDAMSDDELRVRIERTVMTLATNNSPDDQPRIARALKLLRAPDPDEPPPPRELTA